MRKIVFIFATQKKNSQLKQNEIYKQPSKS